MRMFPGFKEMVAAAERDVAMLATPVGGRTWQGMDVTSRPDMVTHEVMNWSATCLFGQADLDSLRKSIRPNLPWADDHFLERVGREPLNPGVQWANWPYHQSADGFRIAGEGQFTHTYMERYWPREAGRTAGGRMRTDEGKILCVDNNRGTRYELGDLDDVVNLMIRDPWTRQAVLPVFFPEDTGAVHGGRIPCTIGYQFLRRGGYVHVVYWIRSCDLVRHFRDDLYLTARLLLWVIDEVTRRTRGTPDEKDWLEDSVRPGMFTIHATSLHCFANDHRLLIDHVRKEARS